MEAQKINGVVVSATKYKDYDVLCNVLTESGIKRVKFSGVRRPNAKMAFAAQPFFCGEFLLSGSKDYAVVMQVCQKEDFYSIAANYDAFLIGSNMLKIVQKIATNETKDILQIVLICLSTLQIEGIDLITIENFFYTKILQILGVWSAEINCSSCGKKLDNGAIVDLKSGALFCKDCAPGDGVVVSNNVFKYLKTASFIPLSELIEENISTGVKTKANEILKKLVENQL